jgi:hypothetical protein
VPRTRGENTISEIAANGVALGEHQRPTNPLVPCQPVWQRMHIKSSFDFLQQQTLDMPTRLDDSLRIVATSSSQGGSLSGGNQVDGEFVTCAALAAIL